MLKQIPTLDTSTIELAAAEPFNFVQGRRLRSVPSGLALLILATQTQAQHLGKHKNATPEDQHEVMTSFYESIVLLFNTVIVEWNLVEYARLDNQAYSPAGQVTLRDVTLMPDDLRTALIAAALDSGQTKAKAAAQKKGS